MTLPAFQMWKLAQETLGVTFNSVFCLKWEVRNPVFSPISAPAPSQSCHLKSQRSYTNSDFAIQDGSRDRKQL